MILKTDCRSHGPVAGKGIHYKPTGRGVCHRLSRSRLRLLAVHPHFPLTLFLRNMTLLEREPNWRKLTPRQKRLQLRRMFRERLAIFLEVKRWASHHLRDSGRKEEAWASACREKKNPAEDIAGYCVNCGMCCEFASALPDFPEDSIVPEGWKRLFGDGLGRGHRFCPFLWESPRPRSSHCSIHPWRANPCRVFEADDCEFVKGDPEFGTLDASRRESVDSRRRLMHGVFQLIDSG